MVAGVFEGPGLNGHLDEGVAGAGGRRRAVDLDTTARQARTHLGPGLVGVGLVLAVPQHLGRQAQVECRGREVVFGSPLVHRNDNAVEADLQLNDVLDPLGGAGVKLRALHAARGGCDVGVAVANPGAEQLDAAAGAEALDLGCLHAGLASELLGHPGGEGKGG